MTRVVWEYDPYPNMSYLEQWDTPEKYKGNEVIRDGRELPFDEYIEREGNPEYHTNLQCTVYIDCPRCAGEGTAPESADSPYSVLCELCKGDGSAIGASCGSIDFYVTDSYNLGIWYDHPNNGFADYQNEMSRDLIAEATSVPA